jgi:hypothetical protein
LWPRSICLPRPLPRFVPPTISTPSISIPIRSIQLQFSVELRVDEPLFSSKQQVYVELENTCCKRLLSVLEVCCKCFLWVLQK